MPISPETPINPRVFESTNRWVTNPSSRAVVLNLGASVKFKGMRALGKKQEFL